MSSPLRYPAWEALLKHREKISGHHMKDLFATDPKRFERFSISIDDFLFDYSKNSILPETMELLLALAKQSGIEAQRDRMFAGDQINTTENWAAWHVALRAGDEAPAEVRDVLAQMRAFSVSLRGGIWKGFTGKPITDIVNIGIGGSDLGPSMATEALAAYHKQSLEPGQKPPLTFHFVSNIDPLDITRTLKILNPETTLFIVASKSFTTDETLTNATTARTWLEATLHEEAIDRHFVAVSTNKPAVKEFGIDPANMFAFEDWVGGRFSICSAIGLPLAIAIGMDHFEEFLAGTREMDRHFAETPLSENMPVIMALVGIWNTNFLGSRGHVILPYDERLAQFPNFLQQLEMESNGKSFHRDGQPVEIDTCPLVFGQVGVKGQHSFYQLIHQGPHIVPCDFIGIARGAIEIGSHRDKLLANFLAQSEALMQGRANSDPHRSFTGNRPSNTILFKQLTPRNLGRLIALYEHKVFVQGVIWGINSFDQFGVELGKSLASNLFKQIKDPSHITGPVTEHDSSTNGLIAHLKNLQADNE